MKRTDSWKLGLFVLAGMILLVGAAFYLGARRLIRPSVEVISFFDESVQGLDTGASIKMRGVGIGKVTEISFAPDRRVVQVTSQIYLDVLEGVGLADLATNADLFQMLPDDLRVRLAVTGITGVRYLEVDSVDPADGLDPVLMFDLPTNHLPARPSTLRGLEQSVISLASSIPVVMQRLESLLMKVETELGAMALPQTLADTRELLKSIEGQSDALDLEAVQASLNETLADMSRAAGAIETVAHQAGSSEGAIGGAMTSVHELADSARAAIDQADLPRLVAALTKVADDLDGLGPDARLLIGGSRETVRDLQQALSAWTSLLRQIEHDPAVLVRGRTKTSPFDGSDN